MYKKLHYINDHKVTTIIYSADFIIILIPYLLAIIMFQKQLL